MPGKRSAKSTFRLRSRMCSHHRSDGSGMIRHVTASLRDLRTAEMRKRRKGIPKQKIPKKRMLMLQMTDLRMI